MTIIQFALVADELLLAKVTGENDPTFRHSLGTNQRPFRKTGFVQIRWNASTVGYKSADPMSSGNELFVNHMIFSDHLVT